MIRIICDHCERDITDHDHFSIRFQSGNRDVLKRKNKNIDICVTCARKFDLNTLIEDEEG